MNEAIDFNPQLAVSEKFAVPITLYIFATGNFPIIVLLKVQGLTALTNQDTKSLKA